MITDIHSEDRLIQAHSPIIKGIIPLPAEHLKSTAGQFARMGAPQLVGANLNPPLAKGAAPCFAEMKVSIAKRRRINITTDVS